jgi:ribosome biogenesis GTPase
MTTAQPVRGVVLSGTGGVWRVRTDTGETLDASLRGRLKQTTGEVLKLAVGDDVNLEPSARGDEGWAIAQILPRRSRLARRAPAGARGERVIAANVDQVVVVFAVAKPEPHPRMLDRFLVIAEANQLPSRIIVNKMDLVGETGVHERFAPYERAGYPVIATSTKTGAGLETLRSTLGGRRSVFTGPSGVGKSSLLNTLFPGSNLRVGDISESVNKGRHTTVGAVMLPLPGPDGGYVIDTPGLREVGLWDLPAERLDDCFPELRGLRDRCRFADCRHVTEPECGVRDAVASGEVSAERYDSYLKLREELEQES